MSVFVRPFRKSDLTAFEPIESMSREEVFEPELAQVIEDSGLSITGIRNGEIVGCGGVHPIDDVHGELWLRLSKECLRHKFDTLEWLRSGLKIIEETYPFRQLNAVVKCGFEKSKRLVEHFGFKPVQTKDDYIIYAKLVRD